MALKMYRVFSDESGHWNDTNHNVYIRAWLKISEEDSGRLEQERPFASYIDLLKEVSTDTTVLFTVTDLRFFRGRYLRFRKSIDSALSKLMGEQSWPKYITDNAAKDIRSAVNKCLFLNIYEKYHIVDALERLNSNNVTSWTINNPQFNKPEYIRVCDEQGLENPILVKERDYSTEMKIVDALSKLLRKMIDSKFSNPRDVNKFKSSILPYLHSNNINGGIKAVFTNDEGSRVSAWKDSLSRALGDT